jgi:hypothetical protein
MFEFEIGHDDRMRKPARGRTVTIAEPLTLRAVSPLDG